MIFKFVVGIFFILFSTTAIAASANKTVENEKKFVTVDVSGSVGNYNGQSYTEAHVGLNLNFTDWLTWRNSVFKRITSGSSTDTTGLDSSLLLSYNLDGISVYAGPGYRWTSDSNKNGLVGQAGAAIQLGKISLGAGAKYLRYDNAQFDSNGVEIKRDDISYYVSISGGSTWTF